ncbi:MAG: glycine--tRNA ligase subunit beta [Candidatus Latescibacterota bacterium]|nr:MAG: glycine--tRNA ligase subunit beta [Candidatus Latescibacterota bacterium]
MRDLILEIGCENLSPESILPASEQLGRDAAAMFDGLRLTFDDVYTTGTPRRLVLIVRGLAASQSKKEETVTGPPAARSFDDQGQPTKPALGFAKSHGIPVAKLERIATDRGDYLGFTRQLKCERTPALLKRVLPGLIAGLKWPKVMRWEESGVQFARPIRWIVCVVGSSVIRFPFAGVRSGDTTHVVPWLGRGRYKVKSADHYLATLEKAGVIVDHVERRAAIEKLARGKADSSGLVLIEDAALIHELTFMLESPYPLTGDFEPRYLKLPAEVVTTAMRAHQRYLALRAKGKRLVPKFLTFTEGKPGSTAIVRQGNEKVLKARLEDAFFYWQDDIRTGVDGLAARLDSIVFIEGLGTLGDKSRRLNSLALFINAMESRDERVPEAAVTRTAMIAKADLASEMVKDGKEFTKLEGLIGSHYASEAKEPNDVVAALREQYMPRTPSDPLPKTALGTLLSVSDRVDTITGCFLAGLVPTGSQDPYALRRQAAGLVRILEHRPALSIRPILRAAVDGYVGLGFCDGVVTTAVLDQLDDFLRVRTETFLKERGIAYDVVAAVGAVAWSRPGVAYERASAIRRLRGDRAFELLITGVKRVGNILSPDMKRFGADWNDIQAAFLKPGGGEFDRGLFADDSEHRLYDAIREAIPTMMGHDEASDVPSILGVLSELGPDIDSYFDSVLVNCPDETLRQNRHRFLAAVFQLFSRYADFSFIVEEGENGAT